MAATGRGDRELVLVTGATQGIGRAIAERLARDGSSVAINGIQQDDAMDAVVASTSGIPAPADMLDGKAVRSMVARLERDWGTVDALVVNHAYMSMGSLVDHDVADWWRVVDTNLGGAFHVLQAVLPGMLDAGRGRIVMVASEAGVTGWAGATAYAASKAGLISLTKALGRELAPQGIIVNAVAPGVVDSPQLSVDASALGITREQMVEQYAERSPLRRIGDPSEIASAVALLLDTRISAFVGQVLQLNGGSTRSRV